MATIQEAFALAGQHCQVGRFQQAEQIYRQVLQVSPNNAQAHYNLAVVLNQQGQIEPAISHYRQALRFDPNDVATLNNLANALRQQGLFDEAVRHFNHALWCQPDCAEVHNNLAATLTEMGRWEEAVASSRQALRVNPNFAAAWNNLGEALKEKRQLDEALSSYRQALRLQPNFPEAYNSMGDAIKHTGKLDEALRCFAEAVRLKPDFGTAHWNRSLLWLLQGDFQRGWPEYEWRWTQPSFVQRSFQQPMWDGSDLGGRTILLHAEQGLGDTIQFVRYAPRVKQRGGRVLFECQPALLRLLAGAAGIDQLLARGAPLPPFDVQIPLLSLPRILKTDLGNMPNAVPYLNADAALVEKWRELFAPLRGLKVGIAWQGNPKFRADRQRSMPLALFAPLAKVEGVHLISLQKGPGTEQLRSLAGRFVVHDLGNRLDEGSGPFLDTAAVIKNLDLVICSDSAVPHLAGALGTPVWVALAFIPDWRWLQEREDSPWYPSMRLFRQSKADKWDDVFERIAGELEKRARHV